MLVLGLGPVVHHETAFGLWSTTRTPLPPPVAAAADVEGGTNVSDSERHGAMFVPARDKAIVTTIEDARSTARRAT